MSENSAVGEKSKVLWYLLGGLGLLFIISSLVITLVEYNRYQSRQVLFPAGSLAAGVPVGGLHEDDAVVSVDSFYSQPLLLEIQDEQVQVSPEDLGFSIDAPGLVADGVRDMENSGFWDYLWGRPETNPVDIPLDAIVDEDQILEYLNTQITPRYLQPGTPMTPIPGTTNFEPGQPGQSLEIQDAVGDIRQALLSSDVQQVSLAVTEGVIPLPPEGMLEAFLEHNINLSGFDDLVEVYAASMTSGEVTHFAIRGGEEVPPDVAFTAASTIKIPIMVSALRRTEDPTPEDLVNLLERMIVFSENPPADTLMSTYIDEVRGPLLVSEDMAALGLENTFLAGYFYLGAPLLDRFETTANQRTDVNLDPDIYSQTVSSEIGQLLTGIYRCAQDGSGLLTEVFPGEISQPECQLMVDILSANKIGLLIEAGLPPDATVAHKHGWAQELDGLLHSMSDAAIVFTPGGDYVLNVFIYDIDRLDFDQGNRLIARLSQTVYNFYNVDNQAYWWFD
jgi:beta-lactamase class A